MAWITILNINSISATISISICDIQCYIFSSSPNDSKSVNVIVLPDKDILVESLFVLIEYVIFVVVFKILSASLTAFFQCKGVFR
jgi:hypothetical protein